MNKETSKLDALVEELMKDFDTSNMEKISDSYSHLSMAFMAGHVDEEPDYNDYLKDLARAALRHALQSGKLAVLNGEGIKEIPCGAANTQNYTASGVGMSWERTATIFEAFRKAGYRPVLIEEEI